MARKKKYFVNDLNTNDDISAPGGDWVREIDPALIDEKNLVYITGAGGGGKGGGGGSRAAVEAPNTLRSAAVARIVEVLSLGPIEGIAGGAQGIYIDNTPLQNEDLSYNFPRAEWDYRVGLPTQDYMPGFSAVEAEIAVNTQVSIAVNNIIQPVSAANIDAARVTILLPQGLSVQDTSNGDLNGTSVSFRIDRRLSGGTWSTFATYTITGKTNNPYEAQYRIERPAGTGLWEVRVTRLTPDPNGSTRNATTFARITEIQDIKISYPDSAVVGIAIDAESVGNEIPKRAYLVKGLLIKIPSNYNPVTRTYTGIWDGLLVNSTITIDNPAWVLYDILTNELAGADIDPDKVDVFSFYDAAVYCDELVPYVDSGGVSRQEPRFTFNARIADRPEIVKLVKAVAGAMNANIIFWNGKWTVIQDRPTAPTKLITKTNVINDGANGAPFLRRSSKGDERHTAFNVSFNDRTDRNLARVVTVESTEGIGRYGYNPLDIAAFGCTTEGQAIRIGKWALDTELNQTETIEFKVAVNGFDMYPGQVISIYDDDYANTRGSGRVMSVSGTTLTLSEPVELAPSSKISVLLADGFTIEERDIVESAGTRTTITVTNPFSTALMDFADFVITSPVSAKQYRIIDIFCPELGVIQVKGVIYDPLKFARVETGISLPSPIFSNVLRTVIEAPTAIEFFEEGILLPNGNSLRNLRVEWTPPQIPPKSYLVTIRFADGNDEIREVITPSINVNADRDGEYRFRILSRDFNGQVSGNALEGSYAFVSGGTTLIPGFEPVQNLFIEGTTSTSWSTEDITVTWDDKPTNTVPAVDYKVDVLTTGDVLLDEAFVTERKFTYAFANNVQQGGPRASVKIRVSARDALLRFANPTTATFTNPPPAAVVGISTIQSFKSAIVKWTPNTADRDIEGYLVWKGTTAGFTPSGANLVFDGRANEFSDLGLADSTTYYYKVAAYDKFSRSETGTGLNVSTAVSVLTLAGSSTNEYRVDGVLWTPNSPSTNQVSWTACTVIKSLGTGAGTTYNITAGSATWTSGILYVYYTEGETIFRSTTTLSNAIADNKIIVASYRGGTNLQIGDGRAFQDGSLIIAGTVGAAQLVVGSAVITQTAQIANAIIDNANIKDLTVDTVKLKNGSISDTRFFVSNTQTTLISSNSSGIFTIPSPIVVAELTVTTPNPSGLPGPFPTYIHASLVTSTSLNSGVNSIGNEIRIVGSPDWEVRVLNPANQVVASTGSISNGSGVRSGAVSGIDNIITLTGGSGTNLVFLAPNLVKNTTYRIQIRASGQLEVSQTGTIAIAPSVSLVAQSRAIYYQCLLR